MTLCVAERIPHSFFINSILTFSTVFTFLQSWGSKICTPFCGCKGVCLLRFSIKILEHRLLLVAQPHVISQPNFLGSSWFFGFPLILIYFFLINTLFFLCIIFLWFTLASIWSEKAFYCSKTFSMWHIEDCQVRSPCFVEHETSVTCSVERNVTLDLTLNVW